MAVTLTVILGKNTFYDVRDMRFVRLKQYDEILQGTVACTDIHTADILPDGLFHIPVSYTHLTLPTNSLV